MKSSDFKEDVSKLLVELGYDVESVSVSGNSIKFKAKTSSGKLEEKTLVAFYLRKVKVGDAILKEVMNEVKKDNYSKAVVFSMSDFTKNAITYVAKKPIDLIDAEGYGRLCIKHGLAVGKAGEDEQLFVYESAFQPGLTIEEARNRFASHRRKMFKYFGRYIEDAPEVTGMLVPAAKVSTKIYGKTKSFFINLKTGTIYYTRQDVIKKKRVLEEGEFYSLFSRLDDVAVSMLGEVVTKTHMPMSKMGSGTDLSMQEKVKVIMRLKARKLIDVVEKRAEPSVYSNFNIPDLKDERFNLDETYESTENLKISFESDKMTYEVEELARKLALFFGENTVLEKVTYVPYYQGVFVDGKSRVRSESQIALKEKN